VIFRPFYNSLNIAEDSSFYAAAQDAYRAPKSCLPKLKLSEDEQMLLAAPRDALGVMEILKAIQLEQ